MSSLPDLSELSHAQKDELIVRLWAQLLKQEERIGQLEARLRLNSRNSSKLPSSDDLSKPTPKSLRLKGQRPVGGQKGHEGNTLRQSARIDEIIENHSTGACQDEWSAHEVIDRRQVFELPVLGAQVSEHRLVRSTCRCGVVHEGRWPEGINAPAQYGERAKALVVHLNQYQLVPLQRTCELLREVIRMLCAGIVHGDLSEFNILLAEDGPVIIDLPQAVDAAGNNHASRMLLRDVANLRHFFGRFAPELLKIDYGHELWDLYQRGVLYPDTLLSGQFQRKSGPVDVGGVLREIDDASAEESARRLRMQLAR